MSTESVRQWSLPAIFNLHQRARRALEVITGLDEALEELLLVETFLRDERAPAEPLMLARTRVLIGSAFGRQGRYAESRVWLEQALPELTDKECNLRFTALNAYAITLRNLGECDAAFQIFDELDKLATKNGTTQERIRILTNKANILYERGEHESALPLRHRAVELSGDIHDTGLRARMLINVGLDQVGLDDSVAAERSLKDADAELVGSEDVLTRAHAMILRGSIALKREAFRDALEAFETGMALFEREPGGTVAGQLQLYAARTHNHLGEFSEAESLAMRAESCFAHSSERQRWLECHLERAKGALGRKDYERAEEQAVAVRDGCWGSELAELAYSAQRLRVDVAQGRGDLDGALARFREAEALREIAFQQKNKQQVNFLRARHEIHELHSREETARARADNLSGMNETLRQKNAELEQLHHEKRELLTIIAHDLRNQLGAAANYTEMALLLPTPRVSELREQLQSVYSITRSTQELLEHLLSLERLESGQAMVALEPLELGQWTRELVDRAASLGRMKEICGTVESPESPVVLKTDETWLRLAVENLLTNAFKYSPPGSGVVVRVRSLTRKVVIQVEDEGPGIPEADREHLFTKFHRTRNQPTGSEFSTGLGLYLVQQYAQLLGAKVLYRSRRPRGSVFSLHFPRGDDEEAVERDARGGG